MCPEFRKDMWITYIKPNMFLQQRHGPLPVTSCTSSCLSSYLNWQAREKTGFVFSKNTFWKITLSCATKDSIVWHQHWICQPKSGQTCWERNACRFHGSLLYLFFTKWWHLWNSPDFTVRTGRRRYCEVQVYFQNRFGRSIRTSKKTSWFLPDCKTTWGYLQKNSPWASPSSWLPWVHRAPTSSNQLHFKQTWNWVTEPVTFQNTSFN